MLRLRELREKRSMTQEGLAEFIGCSQVTAGRYENGKREMSYELLMKLADLFGVSIDYLLGHTNVPNVYEHRISDRDIIVSTKKEPPEQMPREPTMRMDLGAIDELPRDRKQLEQLVSSMIEKALEDHRTNQ
ncbi:MAG: helix-turn-helix transcriptional regulator [Clostridia bacterium]